MILLLCSMLIGFVIAIPIGPVGVLCVRKTLEFGVLGTLAVGMGSALADALYAGLVILGLTAISQFLFTHEISIKIIGGSLLLVLAIKEYFSTAPIKDTIKISAKNYIIIMLTTFLITLLNPMGIASFIALFALLSEEISTVHHISTVVIGVFVGSLSWFLTLGYIIKSTKHLVPDRIIFAIRKISAILLACLAIWAFLSLIF